MSGNVHARLLMTRSSHKRATPASDREERMPEPLIVEELVKLTQRLQHVVNEFPQQIHERIVEVGRADPPERVLDDTATHRRRDGGCARSAGPGADRRGGPQHSSRAGLWAHCGTYRVGFTAADHGGDSIGATAESHTGADRALIPVIVERHVPATPAVEKNS